MGILRTLSKEAWRIAEEHGFHKTRNEMPPWKAGQWAALMLMVSELAEACEFLRDANKEEDLLVVFHHKNGKPDGFGVELADVLIRIFDTAEHIGLDLDALVKEKMTFNEGRPFMHGRGV